MKSNPAAQPDVKVRFGLCCQFAEQPIRFRTATATALLRMNPLDRNQKLAELCLINAESLLLALQFCSRSEIGCFRVISSILPVKTHPVAGYQIQDLPAAENILRTFERCREFARRHGIRLVFHPDQFVVLNSTRDDVVERSIQDLEYHAEVAEWIGADVINIHGGGAYGDKTAALNAFARNFDRLSDAVRSRLTVENDDKVFTPEDLLPLCRSSGIPLVYDIHHHRCLPDQLSADAATVAAEATWNREPLFHISSPLEGWDGPRPERHHDYINIEDFPDAWLERQITVEVEAKAKELAVARLRQESAQKARVRSTGPPSNSAARRSSVTLASSESFRSK